MPRRERPPRRFVLGVTPVLRSDPPAPPAANDRRGEARRRRGRAVTRRASRCSRSAGLCVDYGVGPGAVHAVIDADLVLHRGEVLGLAGESGSGKSTLAYAITRLLRAPGMITGGSVRYHPKPGTTGGPAGRRARARCAVLRWSQISVVMQSAMNALNPVLSIGAQLTDVLQAHRPDLSQAERPGAGRRAAGHGRHHRRPARQLPARAVRRHAAARDDRDGPRPRAAGRDHGRADHRAGRGHPAGDPRGADGAARAARLRRAVHHPRPVAADRDRGLDRGDVRGPAGRAGRRGRALPRAPPPLQPRAAQLLPEPARAAAAPDRHPRLTARPAAAAGRLRLPPALLLRHGPVPDGHARAAAAARGRAGRRVLAAGRVGRPAARARGARAARAGQRRAPDLARSQP